MTLNLGTKKKVSQNVEVRGKSGVVAKTIFDPRGFGLSRIDDGFWEGIEIRLCSSIFRHGIITDWSPNSSNTRLRYYTGYLLK